MAELSDEQVIVNHRIEQLADELRRQESDIASGQRSVVGAALSGVGLSVIRWEHGSAVIYDLGAPAPGTHKIAVSYDHRDTEHDVLTVEAVRGDVDPRIHSTSVTNPDLRHAVAAAQLDCRSRAGIVFAERYPNRRQPQTTATQIVEAIRAVVREDSHPA